MGNLIDKYLGKKVKGARVVPLTTKIIILFVIFILVSNFASNYINLMLNRGELLKLMNRLLVKDLKEMYGFANNQYEIYQYSQDFEEAVSTVEENALLEMRGERSVGLGIRPDGTYLFFASPLERRETFTDENALQRMNEALEEDLTENSITFMLNGDQYFGVYKYNPSWDVFLLRAEELNEFYAESWAIFRNISLLIILIALVCTALGTYIIRYNLRFVHIITHKIMEMHEKQHIDIIDLSHAPNDEVTYLGASFNALSSTINNLMRIFRKFVAKDVAQRAYKELEIRLEGEPRDLAILFSDIKSFTFITETLGTDIIKLLNIHYQRAIHRVHDHHGVIGSIIGDALLAVFGTFHENTENKSLKSVLAAYEIQAVTAQLRKEMNERREEVIRVKGGLTKIEEQIYKAVLLEVGVGIDGGEVFYGNIGSTERMTNTVIGDNVNSASRLEGLTRIYKVPVICSEYIKNEVQKDIDDFYFLELDTVQVKGKTIGKKVYWPVRKEFIDADLQKDLEIFQSALEKYYEGEWEKAYEMFSSCNLPLSEVFEMRTRNRECPENWNGIWTMKTK
ncbi:MAG: adenylate/guanylate cyclase domain-containing protein [Spirochaetia bacterium]